MSSVSDMYSVDTARTKAELLQAIRASSITGFNSRYPGFVMPSFAALLVKLSEEADSTAQRVVRLTRWLIGLTIVLAVLTALLLAEGAKEFVNDYATTGEHRGQVSQHGRAKGFLPGEPVQKSAASKSGMQRPAGAVAR
jgi:hypothetical protein